MIDSIREVSKSWQMQYQNIITSLGKPFTLGLEYQKVISIVDLRIKTISEIVKPIEGMNSQIAKASEVLYQCKHNIIGNLAVVFKETNLAIFNSVQLIGTVNDFFSSNRGLEYLFHEVEQEKTVELKQIENNLIAGTEDAEEILQEEASSSVINTNNLDACVKTLAADAAML